MTNYLVLQVGREALGQQPITRKTNSKAKNTTKQPWMKQIYDDDNNNNNNNNRLIYVHNSGSSDVSRISWQMS